MLTNGGDDRRFMWVCGFNLAADQGPEVMIFHGHQFDEGFDLRFRQRIETVIKKTAEDNIQFEQRAARAMPSQLVELVLFHPRPFPLS